MTTQELIGSLTLSRSALHRNLEGIDDELALRSPGGGANSVNWIVGHLLYYRNATLRQLGAEPVWEDAKLRPYTGTEGAAWDEANAVPVTDLLRAFDDSQERLVAALGELSDEDLQRAAGRRTIGQSIAFLQFHETYHAGQVGLARRLLGLPGAIKPAGAAPAK